MQHDLETTRDLEGRPIEREAAVFQQKEA